MTDSPIAVLDIDGTLIDSNYRHALAWYRAPRLVGETYPVWRLHRLIGMGGDQVIMALGGEELERRVGDQAREQQGMEADALLEEMAPLPGARDLLVAVKERGHQLVLASSGQHQHVDVFLDKLDTRGLADGWTSSTDVKASKPAPDLLEVTLKKLGAPPETPSGMVGDSVWDVKAAEKAGMPAIVDCSGGFGDDELRTAGAIAIYDTPGDLARALDDTPLPDAADAAGLWAGPAPNPAVRLKRPRPYSKGAPQPMTANQTDQASGTKSTGPEAPAEAASDAPTGNPAQPRPTLPEGMGELDRRAIDTVRVLAMDAVQKAGNGHPGTAMSMAPTAYLLFQKWLRHDPGDPNWIGRDRFVLSMGHSSLTLYAQLFLSGYGLELSDLEALRTWGSRTPGHPEVNHTPGVETTTGPLGQGVGNAVGMAMAARRERGLLDPDAAEGESVFDHTVWAFASDGDLEEGVSGEVSSLAGTQELGNLVLVYDANRISIEDNTSIAFTEDVGARYGAYGWHVQHVDDGEDLAAVDRALAAARAETGRPSLIVLRTIIGWPAPNKQNTGAAHRSALGEDEVRATKAILGFDPDQAFEVAPEVLQHARQVGGRGKQAHARWQQRFDAWRVGNPDGSALLDRLSVRTLPHGWADTLPAWDADPKGVATRKASGEVLAALYPVLPELWGGSADLAESNNTAVKGEASFLPADRQTKMWAGGPYGRTLHFGVREHAMGAIMNGIALHGGTRVYGGTFLTFSDYMRGAVRLAALMQLPVTYVWTHDSIGLGEDGPTHQPVEHYAALRAIPGLDLVRPADANETAVAWRTILEHNDRPAGLSLSRQNLPVFDRTEFASAEGVARGGYVLAEASAGTPAVILMGTGSEVQIAVAAREALESDGVPTRVVSLPCWEWFAAQDRAYREEVLPPAVRARVSVEAGVPMGWRDFVGDAGRIVGLDHFGASAAYTVLYEQFGLTADRVVTAARESLAAVAAPPSAPAGPDSAGSGALRPPTGDR